MTDLDEAVPGNGSEGRYVSPLRDLIRRIDDVVRGHIAYSQAAEPVRNLRDHLSAIAFAEEINRREQSRAG